MTNRNKRSGFTLAEVLITVAIIGILMGFGFVEVIRHQRRLQLKEMDEAAQEIFVASQNHLSAAYADGRWINYVSNGGYLGEKDETLTWDDNGKNHDIYYLTVNETTFPELINNYFLPFGAIDETIRSGGSYVIEYDPETASIYDVFFINDRSYNGLVSDRDNVRTMATNSESDRRINYPANNADRKIIGYYGQGKIGIIEVEDDSGVMIQIHNEDILWAEIIVTNPYEGSQQDNMTALFKVEGETSHKSKTFYLKRDWNSAITSDNTNSGTVGTISYDAQLQQGFYRTYQAEQADGKKNDVYIVILDAINYWANDKNNTAHFGKQYSDLIPGENIIVTAYAVDANDSSHAKTNSATTNSLYGSYSMNEASQWNANIYYTRHLQNLSLDISNVSYSDVGDLLDLNTVTVHRDIDFAKFPETSLSEYPIDATDWIDQATRKVIRHFSRNETVPNHLTNGEFHCIRIDKLNSPFTIEGNEHILKNFDFGICYDDRAGLFSHTTIGKVLNVNNLFFEDPKINVQGKKVFVGVIAGCVDDRQLNIENCGVYASSEAIYRSGAYDFTNPDRDLFDSVGIHISGGGVGGFVGKMKAGQLSINSSFVTIPMYNNVAPELVGQCNDSILGGMLGYAYGNSATTISNSYVGGYTERLDDGYYDYMPTSANLVLMYPDSNTSKLFAGGLVARKENDATVTITDSYVSASLFGVGNLGGITGDVGRATITNSYFNGRVVGVKEKTKAIGVFTARTDVSGTGNYVYDYTGTKYSTSLNGINDYFIVPSTAMNALSVSSAAEGKVEKKELPEAVTFGPNTVPFNRRGEVYPYLAVNNTHDPKHTTAGTDRSHYGDWADPAPIDPAGKVSNGNRIIFNVDAPLVEPYNMLVIRFYGAISGNTKYFLVNPDNYKNKDGGTTNNVVHYVDGDFSQLYDAETDQILGAGAGGYELFSTRIIPKKDPENGVIHYTIVFDDITERQGHFTDWCGNLLPGEDVDVSFAYSLKDPKDGPDFEVSINSCFESVEKLPDGTYKAYIANSRHLENLNPTISGINKEGSKLIITEAEQVDNISWLNDDGVTQTRTEPFRTELGENVNVYNNENSLHTNGGYFWPITNKDLRLYEGNNYIIENIMTQSNNGNSIGESAIFGAVDEQLTIQNLVVRDIKSNGVATGN